MIVGLRPATADPFQGDERNRARILDIPSGAGTMVSELPEPKEDDAAKCGVVMATT